jgi:hypothetical protein
MPVSSDASVFTRFRRAVAIQGGDTQANDTKSVNRLSSYATNLSAASSLTEFLSKSKGLPTTPPPPTGLVPTPLRVGVAQSGELTGSWSPDPMVQDVTYKLYTINLAANTPYTFKVVPQIPSIVWMFLGKRNVSLTEANIFAIKQDDDFSSFIEKYAAMDGSSDIPLITINNLTAGFRNLLIPSFSPGKWDVIVYNIEPLPTPTPLVRGGKEDNNFTASFFNDPMLENVNYKLCRINVNANIEYTFNLMASGASDPYIYIGKLNTPFTLEVLITIQNRGDFVPFVDEYNTDIGLRPPIKINNLAAGFRDVLIISFIPGSWSLAI